MTSARPRPALDPSLYLVTDTAMCGDRGVPATAAAAVQGGVTVVQLRDRKAEDAAFVRLGRELRDALRPAGIPLLVNDRVHLVEAIGADGAHVGQSDLDPVAARELLGPSRLLGLSVRKAVELAAASALPPGTVDYFGIGPVWATASKPDHARPLGPDDAGRLASAAGLPGVAIGGITAERASLLRGKGFAGIAVVSAICAADEPAAAAAQLRQCWQAAA
ncbi:thiamine phosphate synthase [Nakamurella aerolata]|uniref:thiamine phosphate synthase n=1 Tax=Nakamurella aerolata TaxID=1656892 RepID=UPI0031B57779